MIDIKWIRENPEKLDKNLLRRGLEPIAAKILELDESRRELINLHQQLLHARNLKAEQISKVQDKKSAEFNSMREDASHINDEIHKISSQLESDTKLEKILENLPNVLSEDVPMGRDESLNKIIKVVGTPKENALVKHHQDLGQNLGMFDTKQTSSISGARFATLTRELARLERALINFMIDQHTKNFGFVEVSPPYLVKEQAMYNVGLLPKFANESFVTEEKFRLIPTGEVSLTNLVANHIVPRETLPIRMVTHTPCFRSEAGSAGRDSRGLIRMHQFSKVELVTITTPDQSSEELEYITSAAENILQKLDLPYRVVLLCSGDTGFQSSKTYDIEVWMPSQGQYREISSCSNCTDFQSRRMKARYKEFGEVENTFVHTLNGSGLAIGRTIAAILENYQNQDGSIQVPQCLVEYMGGVKVIEPFKLNGTIIS